MPTAASQGSAVRGGTSAQKYFQDKQRKMSPGGGRSCWQRRAAHLGDISGQELGFLHAAAERCFFLLPPKGTSRASDPKINPRSSWC